MNNWISTKERLPEYEERVLIYHPANELNRKLGRDIICGKRTATTKNGEQWISDAEGYCCMPVTYWMPLPKRPE